MSTVPAPSRPAVPAPAAQRGRRRRPSGEPPPLPRRLPPRTRWYLLALAATVALWVALLFPTSLRAVTRVDLAVLRVVADLRTPALTWLMDGLDVFGSSVTIWVVAAATVALLLAFRRFQRLAAYLVALLVVSFIETVVATQVGRPRPAGIAIIGPWDGYAHPSRPVAGLALVLAGAVYTLVPAGAWRRRATWAAAAALACLSAARIYLGAAHPTDVLAALVVGWVLPAMIFGWAVPDDTFPVNYSPGPRAHLDIGGRRGQAIRQALEQQLGLIVVTVERFGLGGSTGSTPLRLRVRRGTDPSTETVMFGKLYALSHLRSDRSYKLVRTVRYGRLEDEAPFSSVRRLVEYEDHLLRLFRDIGLPTPAPFGLAEITPEREYLILMEYFPDTEELGQRPLTGAEIDDGLRIVRRMWDGGVAHRDIKPSNVLVDNGRLRLIDVAFGAVRPSPWRQAVDLADMMLCLALAGSADEIYARALQVFSAEDVGEAFAACRGVTIPSQLKARLSDDGRDLIGQFRRLAPPRQPVAIQRWSLRRLGATIGVVAVVAVVVWGSAVYARAVGGTVVTTGVPKCGSVQRMALLAQSVPGASYVPCIASLPPGWKAVGFHATNANTRFSLVSDRANGHPVEVELAPICDVAGVTPSTSRAPGARTFIRLRSISPRYAGTLSDVFAGGCVTYAFDFQRGPHIGLMEEFESAVALYPRQELSLQLHERLGVSLGS